MHHIFNACDEENLPLDVFTPLLEYVLLPVHEVVLINPVLNRKDDIAVLNF